MMRCRIIDFIDFSGILEVLNVRDSSFSPVLLRSCFMYSLVIEVSLLSPSGNIYYFLKHLFFAVVAYSCLLLMLFNWTIGYNYKPIESYTFTCLEK